MSVSPLEYLRHILDEATFLTERGEGLRKEDLVGDETLKRAFVRSLEIIGEATKKLSDDMREKYAHLEWRSMAGMRDKLIHDYFGVDYDLVWDVVTNKIPKLRQDIQDILDRESTR